MYVPHRHIVPIGRAANTLTWDIRDNHAMTNRAANDKSVLGRQTMRPPAKGAKSLAGSLLSQKSRHVIKSPKRTTNIEDVADEAVSELKEVLIRLADR